MGKIFHVGHRQPRGLSQLVSAPCHTPGQRSEVQKSVQMAKAHRPTQKMLPVDAFNDGAIAEEAIDAITPGKVKAG